MAEEALQEPIEEEVDIAEAFEDPEATLKRAQEATNRLEAVRLMRLALEREMAKVEQAFRDEDLKSAKISLGLTFERDRDVPMCVNIKVDSSTTTKALTKEQTAYLKDRQLQMVLYGGAPEPGEIEDISDEFEEAEEEEAVETEVAE